MKWKKFFMPTPKKILLTMILPFAVFVVFFQLALNPNAVTVHYVGETVFSDSARVDTFVKSLIFASVYSIPNWIWSYPLSAFIVFKTERRKKR